MSHNDLLLLVGPRRWVNKLSSIFINPFSKPCPDNRDQKSGWEGKSRLEKESKGTALIRPVATFYAEKRAV